MGAYSSTIIGYAQQNNVDPSLAIAVAQAESGGQQYDASGDVLTSSAGAVGVMQLEPGTAAQYGADPTDPTENIDAGTAYLGDLLNQYGNDTATALAAYNWGPGNLNNAIAAYGTAPVSYNGQTVPAWFPHAPAATQSYVMSILGNTGSSFSVALPTLNLSSAAILPTNFNPGAVLNWFSASTMIGGMTIPNIAMVGGGLLLLLLLRRR
jgi:soluble lytic murein transglycosylase-like protein